MFDRTLNMIDESTFERIKRANILIVGIGGVGGSVLEALVRTGFLNITIIDHDIIEESNLNRQIFTNQENIGELKVNAAKKYYLKINPNLKINAKDLFLDSNNIDDVLKEQYDYIIDACDTITTKCLLIKKAQELNIKIISSMGMGNRFDPTKIKITTLAKTYNDPLAKSVRNILKKQNVSLNIPVVWSFELPCKIKNRNPSSLIFVPMCCGMIIVNFILTNLRNKK